MKEEKKNLNSIWEEIWKITLEKYNIVSDWELRLRSVWGGLIEKDWGKWNRVTLV